jgi:signal transduction histidine kinase
MSRNLHPSTVTQLGLVAALRQLCREFSEQMRIAVDFAGDGIAYPMSEEVAVALFRVSQECLANIAKHSKSRDVRVSLSESPGEVLLTIADHGIGFDVARVRTSGGLGLVAFKMSEDDWRPDRHRSVCSLERQFGVCRCQGRL